MTTHSDAMNLDQVRERLRTAKGQQFWRSLDELADTAAFRELVDREFPQGAAEMDGDSVSRRTFLKLMGASLALAGVTACTYQPREYIAPFAEQPEGRIPGVPMYYASATTLNGYANGVLVRSNDGRPTKIEGNPNHTASLGATDIFTQATLLTMYDPDRSQVVLQRGQPTSWESFTNEVQGALTAAQTTDGSGLRVLTETVTSPTLANQINTLLELYPQARWYQYEPVNRDNVVEGARSAFGQDVDPIYSFDQAAVILSLDADFLAPSPGFLAYARQFANRRRVTAEQPEMNRLYVAEATPSTTGNTADHRLPVQARLVESMAREVALRVGVGAGAAQGVSFTEEQTRWINSVVADLLQNPGASIVIAGDQQPPAVHTLAHAINAALGNVGTTVRYVQPVAARPTNQTSEIAQLVDEMNNGTVQFLLMLGGNPVFSAPADVQFTNALANVGLSAHLSLFVDETSAAATWHVPAAHTLETWSDARAFDGTTSLIQPLIEPLYGSKTAHEVLSTMLGQPSFKGYDIVRAYWQQAGLSDDFERMWQVALSQGFIGGTEAPTVDVQIQGNAVGEAVAVDTSGFELVFRPDPSIWDGSFANNGWLMELPRPQTKLTWDNAALVSPRTAVRLLELDIADPNNLKPKDLEQLTRSNGRMLQLQYRGQTLEIPLWLVPGQPEDSITVNLGYGRKNAGRVGDSVGFDVYPLRTTDALWFGSGLQVSAGDGSHDLVSTQDHWTMEGRHLYRCGNLEEFRENPKYISEEIYQEEYGKDDPGYQSLQPDKDYPKTAWAMTINLSTCIGCNACTIACQAENNIPVVGKDQVSKGREMHWIRIDRYYEGDNLDNPSTYQQPVPCMQCEKAPCELVCPVAATVHDYEGINNMVYNRCVGTKYCSNNCPYKVRRFNFLQYSDGKTITLQLMRNPDVTVRNRGVMEKCNYCAQRISGARIAAKKEAVASGAETYTMVDGAVLTACQQVCPTEAIVFGDLRDENSRVVQWKKEPHNFAMLGELNTKPRTTYLARIDNQNPELAEA